MAIENESDQLLLRAHLNGSETAFRVLVERYGALVYAACFRRLKHAQIAEDAAQAVFVALARKAKDIRVDSSLVNWLLATSKMTCRNFAWSEHRRLRVEKPLQAEMKAKTSSLKWNC